MVDRTIDRTRPYSLHIHTLYAAPDDPACRRRYIQVMVYPDHASMRAAADRYRGTKGDYEDADGVFQGVDYKARYDRKSKTWVDTTSPFAGVMRVVGTHPRLRTILIHEAAHAAANLLRLHQWSKPGVDPTCDLGTECGDDEEHLCYLVGDIANILLEQLLPPNFDG